MINDKTTTQQSNAVTGNAAHSNTGGNFSQTSAPSEQKRVLSFHSGGGLHASVVDRSVKDVQIRTALVEINKIFTELRDKNIKATVTLVDNVNNPALRFSSIVVGLTNIQTNATRMAYHTMIFESSGILENRVEQINNIQTEVILTPADAFDSVMIGIIEERLQASSEKKMEFINADLTVVPRTFDPANTDAVFNLISAITLACNTELTRLEKDFKDLNLEAAKGGNLRINVGYNRDEVKLDEVGNPVRSDITIVLTSHVQGDNRNQNQTLNNGDRVSKISEITGFVDLIYAPEQPQGFNPYGMNMGMQAMQMNRMFVPRFVITSIQSEVALSPASVMLAVYTALALEENTNWMQTFLPSRRSKPGEIDITDIGYLNIESKLGVTDPNVEFGTFIDTRGPTFGLKELGSFVARTIQPKLVISLDVPIGSPSSYFLGFMAAAANSRPEATKIFVKSLDDLTNGGFSRNFQPGSSYFVDIGNKQHLGHYTDRNGVRDIRDIDRLAIVNYFSNAPVEFRHWDETLTRTDYPEALRLAHRVKRINQITGDTARITGFAERVTFSGATLDAMAKGAMSAGMTVTISTPLSAGDFSSQRVLPNFINNALVSGNQMFTHQPQNNFAGFNVHQNGNMRFR